VDLVEVTWLNHNSSFLMGEMQEEFYEDLFTPLPPLSIKVAKAVAPLLAVNPNEPVLVIGNFGIFNLRLECNTVAAPGGCQNIVEKIAQADSAIRVGIYFRFGRESAGMRTVILGREVENDVDRALVLLCVDSA
jgi:hypothetical protein